MPLPRLNLEHKRQVFLVLLWNEEILADRAVYYFLGKLFHLENLLVSVHDLMVYLAVYKLLGFDAGFLLLIQDERLQFLGTSKYKT